MLVLDTDHMSLLEWGSDSAARLRERLVDRDEREVATTIVNYEEQIRGWMAYIAGARSLAEQVEAYQQLRRDRVRIGTMDLKIAAIVISLDATLLSRNRRDFAKVSGLKIED